jgi:SAM-dependent methyltransferase
MLRPVDETSLEPYREAVARHGAGFHATLWRSPESQMLRFDVMFDLVGSPREPAGADHRCGDGDRREVPSGGFARCAVLDVGCGRGDLCKAMLERGIDYGRYVGLDALPEMIDAARQRGFPRARFEVVNVMADLAALALHEPDFCCISGTLNTMDEEAARTLVKAAFDAAAQGVIFNFLSDRCDAQWAGEDLGPARRFNTAGWLDWAMTLGPRVSFTQDYLDGHDATILIRH